MSRRKPIRQAVPFSTIRRRRQRRRALAFAAPFVVLVSISLTLVALAGSHDAGTVRPTGLTADAGAVRAVQPPAPSEAGATNSLGSPTSSALPAPTDESSSAGSETPPPATPGAPQPSPSAPADSAPSATPVPPGIDPPPDPLPTPPTGPITLEPEQLTGYHWPLDGGFISSFFSVRENGFLVVDGQRIHEGLDVATFCGDRVHAAHSGTVLAAGRNFDQQMGYNEPPTAFEARIKRRQTFSQLPIVVVIDDGNGYRSAYVHLERTAVTVGQDVRAGQVIGYEGMTGNASGCHLHYELFRMDGPWMAVASAFVKDDLYPTAERERIDPLRVLSLHAKWAPRLVPGVNPPTESPGLGRPTVHRHRHN